MKLPFLLRHETTDKKWPIHLNPEFLSLTAEEPTTSTHLYPKDNYAVSNI